MKTRFTSLNDMSKSANRLLLTFSLALLFTILSTTVTSAQGTWTKKADFPGEGRYKAASFSIGAKGYISVAIMGSDFPTNDLWEWDQTTNAWTRKADYPGKSGGSGVSFSIGGKGYIGFGYDRTTNGDTNEFWEFDPITNSWTQKASLPITINLNGGVGFSIGNKGYYLNTQDFWEWDQATNLWTKKSNFPGKADDISFSIGNKGYVGLGYDFVANNYINEFWEWNQETNIWTRKADFTGISRFLAVSFSIGNKGYVGTGLSGFNTSWNTINDLWEWDQTINSWTKKADFGGTKRRSATGFSIGNKGYIGLGTTAITDLFYKDFWEFDPSAITGIDEVANGNNFFYPNPASDIITLNTNLAGNEDLTLNIYNVSGLLINSGTLHNSQQKINIEELSNGIYFVEIKSKEGSERQKLIVQRAK